MRRFVKNIVGIVVIIVAAAISLGMPLFSASSGTDFAIAVAIELAGCAAIMTWFEDFTKWWDAP